MLSTFGWCSPTTASQAWKLCCVLQGPPAGDVGMLLSHDRISVVPGSQSLTFSPELLHYLEKEQQVLDYIFFEPSGTRKHIFTVSYNSNQIRFH